jgi:tripartite-type tricarboxylate transporter receptor subunit TctC
MVSIAPNILKCAVVAALLQSGFVAAQGYPAGPLRMIVPFPPGGGTDILGRIIAQKLNEAWGQPVVVDNRGGANGTIGAAVAAKAAPDGHTMLIVPSGFAVNPSIYKNLSFDSAKDLAPVTQLSSNPSVLAVHPSFPPRTVKELIAFVTARPNEINYASSGNGSPPHLMTELFKLMTGTRMTHVPYKGGGPATVAVVAGEVPVYILAPAQAATFLKSGRLRGLGVTSDRRDPAFPDLPTIAEAGVPGYAMTNWYGLFVPAGTSDAALTKLSAEMVRIVNLQEIRDRLAAEGSTVVGSTPAQFATFLKAEMAKAARVVKAAGITASN